MSEEFYQTETDVSANLNDDSNDIGFTELTSYAILKFCKENGTNIFQNHNSENVKAIDELGM